MAEITVRVEKRSGIQTISILERHHLTAVKMPGQDQVVALVTRDFPDARIVGAQYLKIAVWQCLGARAGDRNHPRPMRYASGTLMNPLAAAACDRSADSIHADPPVVVAADSEDGGDLAKRADQRAKRA
jgi:hypothetical protein